ncbi:MAG: DUF1254 domain-containing protein [Chitinophagales bacterium]
MKNYILYILLFLLVSIGAYKLTIHATPYAVLFVVKLIGNGVLNEPVYTEAITDKERRVVMPNPDFIYVAMGYNLYNGPVRISGKMPEDSYASVALYNSNTQNYFVLNDRETPNKSFTLLLSREENTNPNKDESSQLISSPSGLGVVLMRILVKDKDNLSYFREIQQSFKAEVVEE